MDDNKQEQTMPEALPPNTHGGVRTEEETRLRQETFAQAYASSLCNVTLAAQRAGITPPTYYDWLKKDAAFVERMEEAERAAKDTLRNVLLQRGTEGHRSIVLHNGRQVLDAQGNPVYEYHPSNQVLMFLARAHLPEHKALTIAHEVSGPGGGPIQIEVLLKQYLLIEKRYLVDSEIRYLQQLAATIEDRKKGEDNGYQQTQEDE